MPKPSPNFSFIVQIIQKAGISKEPRKWILEAYANGYDAISDGCSFVPELAFDHLKMKNPICVAHDWLYYKGKLPREEADLILKQGLIDFGYPKRAVIWYWAVRLFGWRPWWTHRFKEKLRQGRKAKRDVNPRG